MKTQMVCAAALLLAWGCGDDSGPSGPVTFPDLGGEGATTGSGADIVEPASDDGGQPGDDVPAAPGDGAVALDEGGATEDAPVKPPPPPEVAELCAAYCGHLSDCAQPYGGTAECPLDCAANIATDAGWVNSYLCAAFTQCQNVSACTAGPIATAEQCVSLCAAAEDCDVFPSVSLGQDEGGCVVSCSIQVKFNPVGHSAFQECALAALGDGCSDAAVLACNEGISSNTCNVVCAGGQKAQGPLCNQVPSAYESKQACLTDCESWSEASKWMGQFCVNQFGCEPGSEVCFPPPESPAPGSAEFCQAAYALCGGEEGFGLPKDVDVCSWIMTGLSTASSFDYNGSVVCLAELGVCPEEPNLIYGCLVDSHEPCVDYCAYLIGCGANTTQGGCEVSCNFGYAADPDATTAAIECVANAGSCIAAGQCFQGDGGG